MLPKRAGQPVHEFQGGQASSSQLDELKMLVVALGLFGELFLGPASLEAQRPHEPNGKGTTSASLPRFTTAGATGMSPML